MEFYYAIYANRLSCLLVNKNIGRMHVFQKNSISHKTFRKTFCISSKALGCHIFLYLVFSSKTFTFYKRLSQYGSEQTFRISGKTNYFHQALRKQRIMQNNGIKGLLKY